MRAESQRPQLPPQHIYIYARRVPRTPTPNPRLDLASASSHSSHPPTPVFRGWWEGENDAHAGTHLEVLVASAWRCDALECCAGLKVGYFPADVRWIGSDRCSYEHRAPLGARLRPTGGPTTLSATLSPSLVITELSKLSSRHCAAAPARTLGHLRCWPAPSAARLHALPTKRLGGNAGHRAGI